MKIIDPLDGIKIIIMWCLEKYFSMKGKAIFHIATSNITFVLAVLDGHVCSL